MPPGVPPDVPARGSPGVTAGTAADLRGALVAAVDGRFPPADGSVVVVDEPIGAAAGVIAFSAHFFVCAPVSPTWVAARVDTTDFTATQSPTFLLALGDAVAADIGALDVVLATRADDAARDALAAMRPDLVRCDDADHPRVVRARRYRDDLAVWRVGEGDGWLVIGRGVCHRWEASFEVAPRARGSGLGRRLAAAAAALVPSGSPVYTQVAPGNVASLRAVLAVGYQPVASEVLLPPRAADRPL